MPKKDGFSPILILFTITLIALIGVFSFVKLNNYREDLVTQTAYDTAPDNISNELPTTVIKSEENNSLDNSTNNSPTNGENVPDLPDTPVSKIEELPKECRCISTKLNKSALPLPSLPTAYEWLEVEPKEATPIVSFSECSGEYSGTDYPLTTEKSYKYVVTFDTHEDYVNGPRVTKDLENNLKEQGWSNQVIYGDYEVAGLFGGEPVRSVQSMVKNEGSTFRVVQFWSQVFGKNATTINSPDYGPPYEYSVYVYFSEPVDFCSLVK